MQVTKFKAPQYTMAARVEPPGDKTLKPGPGAHSPEKVGKSIAQEGGRGCREEAVVGVTWSRQGGLGHGGRTDWGRGEQVEMVAPASRGHSGHAHSGCRAFPALSPFPSWQAPHPGTGDTYCY